MIKKSNTKERILEAAMELFWTRSYGSVSVDDICKKATVQKGSFYHYFPSKSELCIECFNERWKIHKPIIDEVFASSKDPLKRIKDYALYIYKKQKALKEEYGYMLSCPFAATGSERSNEDIKVRDKAKEMFDMHTSYFQIAIKDANKLKLTEVSDPAAISKELGSYLMGVLYQAKINNDPEIIKKELKNGFMRILNVKQ